MEPQDVRITERENPVAASLDTKSTGEILRLINLEDAKVAPAVKKTLPQVARAVELAAQALARGGRLVYLGAGTSGRLGMLDAAECIPTFATKSVRAVMAGAPASVFRPSEASEDDPRLAVRDLRRIKFSRRDVLVGISASGRTPYTLGGMRYARRLGATVVGLTSNPSAPLRKLAQVTIIPVVGPEVLAGSTRMKAGTAQKLVLNMLSTTIMVRLGRVFSAWMVNLQLNNQKLRRRGERILMQVAGASAAEARASLDESRGNLPLALLMLVAHVPKSQANRFLESGASIAGFLRKAWSGRRPRPIPAGRCRARGAQGKAEKIP